MEQTFPTDIMLRRAGFEIQQRPADGPAIWQRRGGKTMIERDAVVEAKKTLGATKEVNH